MIGADGSTARPQNRGGALSTWARGRVARVLLPSILLVAFVAEFVTREGPDYTLHSWVGIALIPIITVHMAGNAGWIRGVWRRGRQHREFGLGVLNASFGVLVAVCIGTGFPLWLGWSDATGWSATHTVTGFASILVMFVHLWRNRARVVRLLRPRVNATGASGSPPRGA